MTDPAALWQAYLTAAQAAYDADFRWRMNRSANGASGLGGFLFQQAYAAQNAADDAYKAWQAAYRAANPGARG